jgi:hypothetical protein
MILKITLNIKVYDLKDIFIYIKLAISCAISTLIAL